MLTETVHPAVALPVRVRSIFRDFRHMARLGSSRRLTIPSWYLEDPAAEKE